ncbi:MAG: S8 family serine peptidase, partial [Candidatus Aquicultor sp.]
MFFLNKTKALLAASTTVVLLAGQTAALAGTVNMNRAGIPATHVKDSAGISKIKQILIRPKSGVSLKAIEAINARLGGKRVSKLPKLGVIKVTLGNSDINKVLNAYNASGMVEYAEPNYTRKAALFTPNDPQYP